MIDFWKDIDRKSFYRLDEVYYYPDWEAANIAYKRLSSIKKQIWVQGSYLKGKAITTKKIFNRIGIINYLSPIDRLLIAYWLPIPLWCPFLGP